MSSPRGLRLAAVFACARGGVQAAQRHRWVMMSSQRSGTAFVTDYLRTVPCVMASSEMFLDRGALVWDAATQRSCLDAFAGTADDAARARPRSNLTAKFDVMLDRTRAAEAGGAPVASGFKWMANQAAKRHWPRFVDGCAKNGVRLLFLLRRNVLRQLVSRTLNQADRDRTSPTYAHHAHPDDDARLAQQRRARATLPEGARLIAALDKLRTAWADLDAMRLYALARGVPAARILYEDVDEDHGLFNNVTAFLLGGASPDDRRRCAAARESAAPAVATAKLHATAKLADAVANWAATARSLRHTAYAPCLEEGPAEGAAALTNPASSFPLTGPGRPCWREG